MRLYFSLFILCLPLMAGEAKDFKRLTQLMTGSFDSSQQAGGDDSYYSINLEMHQIWPDRKDGYWLYVEQAMSSRLEKPYRQRVYQVTEGKDGSFISTVYKLPNEETYIGAQADLAKFDDLKPEDLLLREGCKVVLKARPDGTFAGSTVEDECGSSLRGATYATSMIEIYKDRMISWDRGFDAEHQQVWGAEAGGYVFVRK